MKSTHTPIARFISRAYRKAVIPELKEKQTEATPAPQAKKISRKDFFSNTVMAGAAVALPTVLQSCNNNVKANGGNPGKPGTSVAIIGAGIAGLNAAHLLNKNTGIKATIYEASTRTGGRMMSGTNIMASGITTELGGEFIDSSHKDMISLAKEFNLELMDCLNDVKGNKLDEHTYFFGGKKRTDDDVARAFFNYAQKIQEDKERLEEGDEAYIQQLDKLSMKDYMQKRLGIKETWLYDLLYYGYTAEFGLYPEDFGCLNFIDLVGVSIKQESICDEFDIFGKSDERYKVRGGNQLITDKLTEVVKDQVKLKHKLVSIKKEGRQYVLNFNGNTEIKADYVLITIPFSVLKEVTIDSSVNLPALKKEMIAEVGFGKNSKLMMGAKDRIWRKEKSSGYIMTEIVQNGWDNSQLQGDNKGPGGYSVLLGGKDGENLQNTPETVEKHLTEIERVFKGAKANYTGKSQVMNWNKQEFAKGSYSCYKVGHWIKFKGKIIDPVDNLFFAGEHCSEDFYGFMNGSAETARRAVDFMTAKMLKDIMAQSPVAASA